MCSAFPARTPHQPCDAKSPRPGKSAMVTPCGDGRAKGRMLLPHTTDCCAASSTCPHLGCPLGACWTLVRCRPAPAHRSALCRLHPPPHCRLPGVCLVQGHVARCPERAAVPARPLWQQAQRLRPQCSSRKQTRQIPILKAGHLGARCDEQTPGCLRLPVERFVRLPWLRSVSGMC